MSSAQVPVAPPCSAAEERAWAGLVRAHGVVARALDRRLNAERGWSLTHYDVIAQLDSADGCLAMTELAARVGLSPSRISRVVDQLQAAGLVDRDACAQDGRVTYATLSEAGRTWLAGARATYRDELRARFLDRLTPQQVAALGEVWSAVADGAGAVTPPA